MTNETTTKPSTRGEALRRIQMGLRRLTQQLHRLNDVVGSQINLLPGDLEVLDMLGRDGPMSPRDVTAATGIHPATLTGILDRFEAGGWLTRRPDPNDRRRVILAAETRRGGDVSRRYAPMTRAITDICSDYSVEELARIVEFLERTTNAGTQTISEIRAKRT